MEMVWTTPKPLIINVSGCSGFGGYLKKILNSLKNIHRPGCSAGTPF